MQKLIEILEKYDDNISESTDEIILAEIKKLNLTKPQLEESLNYMINKYRESEREVYYNIKYIKR